MSLAVELSYWQQTMLRSLGALAAVLLPAGTIVYLFLFKMMSFMQSRLGPIEAGPYGSMQLLAEVGKWLQKEDLFPRGADRRVFALAPIVVVMSTFLIYTVIPFGPDAWFTQIPTGIFFALALSSISVIGILMAGWASANKYSVTGGLRAAGQLIAYELPMVLAVVGVVVQAGTMSLQGIVHAQAELTQTPFDMPVAESELVAGYLTEYTGVRFLLFFMAEFASAFAFAAIASTIFLGGWYIPGVHGTTADLLGPVVMIAKTMAVGFVIFWVRFTFPRFREDQLQAFAWKYLIPLSLLNILVTGILKVVL